MHACNLSMYNAISQCTMHGCNLAMHDACEHSRNEFHKASEQRWGASCHPFYLFSPPSNVLRPLIKSSQTNTQQYYCQLMKMIKRVSVHYRKTTVLVQLTRWKKVQMPSISAIATIYQQDTEQFRWGEDCLNYFCSCFHEASMRICEVTNICQLRNINIRIRRPTLLTAVRCGENIVGAVHTQAWERWQDARSVCRSLFYIYFSSAVIIIIVITDGLEVPSIIRDHSKFPSDLTLLLLVRHHARPAFRVFRYRLPQSFTRDTGNIICSFSIR